MAPGKVVVDKEPGGASSLDPCVVEPSDRSKRRIRAAALQDDRERGECLLKIAGTEQAPIPGKCRVEIIHEILRKDVGISRRKRVQGLRRKSVEQRIDGICIGGLESVVRLKAKPGGVFLIDVVIDSNRLDLFMIVARMRNALAIGAAVSIIRNGGANLHPHRTDSPVRRGAFRSYSRRVRTSSDRTAPTAALADRSNP